MSGGHATVAAQSKSLAQSMWKMKFAEADAGSKPGGVAGFAGGVGVVSSVSV